MGGISASSRIGISATTSGLLIHRPNRQSGFSCEATQLPSAMSPANAGTVTFVGPCSVASTGFWGLAQFEDRFWALMRAAGICEVTAVDAKADRIERPPPPNPPPA